jgi:hypothetical protein
MNTYLRNIVCLTFICLSAGHAASPQTSAVKQQNMGDTYGRLPLSFEANQGQTDSRVKFLSRGSGYSLFLTQEEAVLALKKQGKRVSPGAKPASVHLAKRSTESQSKAVLRMRLVGANASAALTGVDELPGKSNYFIGNDPGKWRTNVSTYARVKYAKVYPGVDLIYYGNQRQLEFDLVVQPGGDPNAVRLDFRTAVNGKQTALRINEKGDLVVGEVIFHKPVVYQPTTKDETRATPEGAIDGKFVLTGAQQVGFQIATYDRSKPLVIDPTLAYSTYLGGNDDDYGVAIAVDASGDAYVTGTTASTNFPITAGAFQPTLRGSCNFACTSPGGDVFVSKLNAAGSALIYSTYLGGTNDDLGAGIAIDAKGNAYVTGQTRSFNFPVTPGAFQPNLSGSIDNAFVTKLNATGSALLYSTFLGGSVAARASGIAVDASGNAYVTGTTGFCSGTCIANFPTTPGALQTTYGGGDNDLFVTKLNATGSALVYSTYLGGKDDEFSAGIAVDGSGNAFVGGSTRSSNFPVTPGAFKTTFGGMFDEEVFATKLNAAGSALLYSTYLGSAFGGSIAIDASGNAYLTGYTQLSNFPITPGAFNSTFSGSDVFVSKLNAAGSGLVYSTFLGQGGGVLTGAIAVDKSGDANVTGTTTATNFPTTLGAFQTTYGGDGSGAFGSGDAFFSKLNASGSALLYSTFLGGSDNDHGIGIAVDASGNAYVTGSTFSSNFPTTPGAFQRTFGGQQGFQVGDAFVSKFSFAADLFLRIIPSTTTVHQGDLLTYAFPVWNLGPDVAEGEVLSSLQVPAGTTFDYIRISGTPGLGTCTHPPYGGTGQIICHEGDGMAPNTTWTVRLTVKVTAPSGTVITESAATMSDTPDPNLANNMATVSIKVQ